MTTKNIRYLIFASILLLMSTCVKDSDIQKRDNFLKTYVFDSYYVGAIKGYTETGEFTDIPTINDFIKEKKGLFWLSDHQINVQPFKIEIITDTTAKISYSETSFYYNLIRKNGIVYLQSPDTLNLWDRSILDMRLKYVPLYFMMSPLGLPGIYTPCIYIIESNGELHIPFLSYLEKRYTSTGEISFELSNNNNVFNTYFLNRIQKGDTIVYQDNMMIYKEKKD